MAQHHYHSNPTGLTMIMMMMMISKRFRHAGLEELMVESQTIGLNAVGRSVLQGGGGGFLGVWKPQQNSQS